MSIIVNKNPFDKLISSRKVNKSLEFQFDRGWSPILAPVLADHKVYLKLANWIDGEGDMPFDPTTTTYYLGALGLTTDVNQAVDIAQDFMTDDWLQYIIDERELSFTVEYTNSTLQLKVVWKDLEGNSSTSLTTFIKNELVVDADRHDTNKNLYGLTARAISDILYQLKTSLIINDYTSGSPNYSQTQALSHNEVMKAIDEARAKFDVPIIELTTPLIQTIQGYSGITTLNPYYAIVSEDNRTNGVHSDICTETCVSACCDNNIDGGYEERGNISGITGCLCTSGVEEVNARCTITVTDLGEVNDVVQVLINGNFLVWYEILAGDTIVDVYEGLISSLNSQCGGDGNCTIISHDDNTYTFILEAIDGLGSAPNNWTHNTIGDVTFTLSRNGVDYEPSTYRGVRHHVIAWDGEEWHDFGTIMSFGNNNINGGSCVCTFLSQSDTPDSYDGQAGKIVVVNGDEDGVEFQTNSYINLTDTTDTTYTAKVGQVPAVNSGANALELTDPQTLVNNTFIGLTDTPTVYTSKANYKLKVNNTPNAVEFVDDTYLNLNDTSDTTYNGKVNYVPSVNGTATQLELKDPQTLVNNTFIGLSDVSPLVEAKYFPIMNDAGTAVNFEYAGFKYESKTLDSIVETHNNPRNTDVITSPVRFQLEDDVSDTTDWEAEHVGRMKVTHTNVLGKIRDTLWMWAINSGTGLYGWQEVKTFDYTPL